MGLKLNIFDFHVNKVFQTVSLFINAYISSNFDKNGPFLTIFHFLLIYLKTLRFSYHLAV